MTNLYLVLLGTVLIGGTLAGPRKLNNGKASSKGRDRKFRDVGETCYGNWDCDWKGPEKCVNRVCELITSCTTDWECDPQDMFWGGRQRFKCIDGKCTTPPSCVPPYDSFPEGSTLCDYWDKVDDSVAVGLPEDYLKGNIVTWLNQYRNNVSEPETYVGPPSKAQPKPARMHKLYWDNDLQKLAQKWAQQCPSAIDGHMDYYSNDFDGGRRIPGYSKTLEGDFDIYPELGVAQVVSECRGHWWGHTHKCGLVEWPRAMWTWKRSNWFYTYPADAPGYSRIIQDSAIRVGCGMADCSSYYGSGTVAVYVCNFAGAVQHQYTLPRPNYDDFPYKKSDTNTQNSGCDAEFKDNGLCDCGDKICANFGQLGPDCKCVCNPHFPFTGGDCTTPK